MVSRGWFVVGIVVCLRLHAQVIEFESNGLLYKTLTRGGVTVMFAGLPVHIRDYAVVQIAVSNGSPISWTIKPEDVTFEKSEGDIIHALPAQEVVMSFIKHSSRSDVIKLVSTYEAGLYGNTHLKSTNGYETRRQNALAEVSSKRIKAGAAASAIVLAPIKLRSGESTDGAVFFPGAGKSLGPGHLRVKVAGETFDFESVE